MSSKRYHIIVDMEEVGVDRLNDKKRIYEFLTKLPGMIGMNILEGPIMAEGVEDNPGITGFVIIDYSHISIHTFTISKTAMVDSFSCKEYDQQIAKQAILKFFKVPKEQAHVQIVRWP